MKRYISFVLSFVLILCLLSGCGGSTKEVRILSMENSPCVAIAHMLEENPNAKSGNLYVSSTVNITSRIKPLMEEGTCDIVILPSEAAVSLYHKTGKTIRVLAGISVGGYELLSAKDEINSITALKGSEIYFTERDKLPENLTEYLLSKNGVNPEENITTNYASSIKQLAKQMSKGEVKYAVLDAAGAAEIKAGDSNIKSLDLTAEWNKITSDIPMISYVVITTEKYLSGNKKAINSFLSDLENSLKSATGDSGKSAAIAKESGLADNAEYAKAIIESARPYFISGEELKTKLSAYYNVIDGINTNLLSGALPGEEFYYIAS